MKAKQAIDRLTTIMRKYGDLPIVGGCILDDTPLKRIIVVDEDGCDVENREPKSNPPSPVAGIFLES